MCEVTYTVYRLSTGAYFKYSSGGTPVLLWGLGYGYEGADDVGSVYRFTLGDRKALPVAGILGMEGMREGGRRRILVPPQLGWGDRGEVGPLGASFGSRRRLANHYDEALLLEVELRRAAPADPEAARGLREGERLAAPRVVARPYALPAPPSPFRDRLGE